MIASIQIARVLISIVAGTVALPAAAAAPKAVSYTCADGTRLQATFSPPSSSPEP